MASTILQGPPEQPATRTRLALAVADASWFTTENLFRDLRRPDAATLLLKCLDYRNAWRAGGRPWSWGRALDQDGPRLWRRDLVLPSGWMKTYPRWGMRPIRRAIHGWRSRCAPSGRLALVMTYPHYIYLRDMVRPDVQVYFNLDDYTLYWPRSAGQVEALERRLVGEADLTVCVSRARAERLRAAVPGAAAKVRHLPHGTPSFALSAAPHAAPSAPPDDLAHLPRPLLGYVGSLEDRVDWVLLTRLAEAMPGASIVLVGRPPAPLSGDWHDDCRRCLARPNVHAIGWRPQQDLVLYNRAFDVGLIPYLVDHPFNQACCPTKIMDTMGTGRPIVATALPECRLYGHLFDVAEDQESFVAAVRRIVADGSDDGRAAARHEWARENTCERVAGRLLDWLDQG
jgi:hypothetical protein